MTSSVSWNAVHDISISAGALMNTETCVFICGYQTQTWNMQEEILLLLYSKCSGPKWHQHQISERDRELSKFTCWHISKKHQCWGWKYHHVTSCVIMQSVQAAVTTARFNSRSVDQMWTFSDLTEACWSRHWRPSRSFLARQTEGMWTCVYIYTHICSRTQRVCIILYYLIM